MAPGYTNVFGGENRSPAQLSYAEYVITTSIELQWPVIAAQDAYVAFAKLDIQADAPGLTVKLPAADRTTVGQDILFRNIGANSFTVVDQTGNTIVSIASGISWFLWVSDSADPDGEWALVQFGASVSSANAAALAGAGLKANITRLDQNLLTTPVNGNRAIGNNDRATVLKSTGGVAVWTLLQASSYTNGFFFYAINAGSGTVTLTPSVSTIDGAATKVLQPGESCAVFSDGTNFWTLGYGRSLVNTVTGASIDLSSGGTITLDPSDVRAQVQDWNGTLPSNTVIEYGPTAGFWFVWNDTTGAFTVRARVDAIDPGVLVAQGTFSILRSNGTNMEIAFSASTGTVTSVGTTVGELTGGPITTSGTIGLANTAVAPGSYGSNSAVPVITVDQKGRITAASTAALGTAAVLNGGGAPGNVPVLNASGLVPSQNGGMWTGAIVDTLTTSPPAGWVYTFGTIGNAASGASNRANADTLNLFTLLWALPSTAVLPGGKGANAAADFAANKTITVIDGRGRGRVTRDNLGGSAANRTTSATMVPDGNTILAVGGAQTETAGVSVTGNAAGTLGALTVNTTSFSMDAPNLGTEVATGSGTQVASINHIHNNVLSSGSTGPTGVNFPVGATGSTASVTNMGPSIIVDTVIKL